MHPGIAVKNRLDTASSPYLRQHGDNPVDWYPWGREALERARAEVALMNQRPSLLEVQKMLSAIPGSLSADFIAEREDR